MLQLVRSHCGMVESNRYKPKSNAKRKSKRFDMICTSRLPDIVTFVDSTHSSSRSTVSHRSVSANRVWRGPEEFVTPAESEVYGQGRESFAPVC